MNAPIIHRAILKRHLSAIEAKYPIRFVGLLPRAAAAHVDAEDAVDLLPERRPGLDLWGLCEAEDELGKLLGRPVGIVLVTGLSGEEAIEFPKIAQPL